MPLPYSLPKPPQTQARSSHTFRPPPLDGSLTLAQIYDWHFRNTPHHRLFVYAHEEGSTRTILWREGVRAVYQGARILRDRFKWMPGLSRIPIVSILASSDTIPYFVLFVSCLRANYLVFPISPRNSPSAVAYLIDKVGVNYLLIGHEPTMQDISANAIQILKDQYPGTAVPDVSYVPLFEDLFLPQSEGSLAPEDIPYEYHGPDAPALVIHSSGDCIGSTAFPKPIYWSNHRIIQGALIPWFGGRDLTDQVMSLHSMPMYHGMGLLQTMWGPSCGLVYSAFEPRASPTVPSPENLFRSAKATLSDIILCVPSFLEAWAREPEYVEWLATRTGVLYGGGPLNKDAGDYLTSQGVSIFILYGSSEGGIMSPILPAHVGYDWNYFQFPELVTAEMVPHGDNTFELVMVSNVFCRPSVLNTQIRGADAYATSDLMVPHPTKPGYWRIFGRSDDQIMHSTGEKTNPGPLENMLNQDPHVLSSVMFGRGQFQAGVIVDPKPAFKFDPSDSIKLAEFRNLIWPTVEKMNAFAPQHSRIFKEMIIVAKPSKKFTYTAKMTARRQAIIADYASEISNLYATVEETTQSNITPPEQWDPTSTLDFVREVIRNVMTNSVEDDEDIFQHGCDSLQATWIRNALLRALRDSAQLDTRRSTHNFVYDYPSISGLALFIFSLVSGTEHTPVDNKVSVIHGKVSSYTRDFPLHIGEMDLPSSSEKVVMITGTTGELGCYLLAVLVADNSVSRIYALNRSLRDSSVLCRQSQALVDRGLDPTIVDSQKLVLLEADISSLRFDVEESVYREMQESVTHIIHAAWPVDFNLALVSFEPNIRGVRNIIDFSLGSPFREPPMLLFISSIGIFRNFEGQEPLVEGPVSVEIAVGTGYTESKWISEQIILKSVEFTPLKALIVRVGQLCGGINGAWNVNEWVPALIQSARDVGYLPGDGKNVAWLPVDVAAAAIFDFLSVFPRSKFVHLIHPRPVSWATLGNVVARELAARLVPYSEWVSHVENMPKDKNSSRAARLLPFFRSLDRTSSGDAFGFPKLDMRCAMEMSVSLRSLSGQLGEEDVKRWIGYWRSVGLL
ncbi:hypothetical protein C8J57DRAFT_1090832 [Mycena rebaudengoi]|nr:hypothetical protein C8J57DRAFT_1090832 [Mycena rebaudengoi]